MTFSRAISCRAFSVAGLCVDVQSQQIRLVFYLRGEDSGLNNELRTMDFGRSKYAQYWLD